MNPLTDSNLILRALIILGLIAFGFFVVAQKGLLTLALTSDRSYISYVIFVIYLIATLHWLWLARGLSIERRHFYGLESQFEQGGPHTPVQIGLLGRFFGNLNAKKDNDPAALLSAFNDELLNRHALGHFLSDVLLKLGLLGTIVGFILMLLPVGELKEFDPSLMQRLLSSMSGGMAVALYTTLAGLVTSTLLKVQYHVLDTSAVQLCNRLAVLTDLYLGDHAAD
ncbi:MAG: MotA/TolQ/ExbB proton channel family protein [Proteobacteria bacterium]|nr:MotA/TolQ/ExbB proton channel family protein [Pseudomonadota bacterium]